MGKHNELKALERIDSVRVNIKNAQNIPITLFANEDVSIEYEGIVELLRFTSLSDTLSQLWEKQKKGLISAFWGDTPGKLEEIVMTPDFHKGAGIPVGTVAKARGFVIPQAIGNDICCGMRLLVTDVTREELAPHIAPLLKTLRGIFFQGERDIPMSPGQREALLRDGLHGLYDTHKVNQDKGLWKYYDPKTQLEDLSRIHFQGGLHTRGLFSFDDFIKASGASDSRDNQIGSVGGGNHFVEIQSIDEVLDGATAHAWGLSKNAVTIMAHSGSVGLGHMVGGYFMDKAKGLYPKNIPHPEHGFYVIPTSGKFLVEAEMYLDAMRTAANFAFANRLFLTLMAVRAMSEVIGRKINTKLIYDAPHNLIWEHEGGDDIYLHRKGACPAPGMSPEEPGPFQYTGHPVIIPGSMGASSYVLVGQGSAEALCSACHGAGRSLSRGASQNVKEEDYQQALESLHVVTPIDPESPQIKSRRDILEKHHSRLKEEAPYAYKSITSVVQSVEDANIAKRVVRLWPMLTVKG
jgi:tRNA-splicing ligase RtcB (3'-phosphate/5'-hydroxy nucleic acid ligase)